MLRAAPAPSQSATALADATGWQQWVLDCIEALAISLAVNLPASALIALGVKLGAGSQQSTKLEVVDGAPYSPRNARADPTAPTTPNRTRRRSASSEAERFGVAMLRPATGARLSPAELRAAYLEWCAHSRIQPLPISEIAPALGALGALTDPLLAGESNKSRVATFWRKRKAPDGRHFSTPPTAKMDDEGQRAFDLWLANETRIVNEQAMTFADLRLQALVVLPGVKAGYVDDHVELS